MPRLVGLDAGSRDALLDLIYRLSREDKDGGDKAGGDGKTTREVGSSRVESGADDGDADVDPERARKDRAKEARRAEKEREKKEKVLAKALKKDRKASVAEGGNGNGNDGDAQGWASSPHPSGSEANISVTSAQGGGETKVMKIKRAADLKDFLSAAKSKLKLKKKPLSVRLVPSGKEIHDTLRLEPMATVAVSSDPPATKPPKREDKKDKEKSAPGDDAGDGDGDDDGDDPTERLRAGMRARAASERARSHRSHQSQESTADESARLLSLLSIASTDGERTTMAAQRASLPAAASRPDIIAACVTNASPAAVITGETGSGKTTQAPQFVLEHFVDAGHGARCGIVVCQPRRVAAVSIARRVAEERGEKVGDVVGYRVRGESRTSNRTRLTFCTTGVLLQRLQWDPTLADITHVFVDEAHERTADADFLLIHLRRLLRSGESKLRVTLMSATVDASKFTNYFAGAGLPVPGGAHIPGRTFPVNDVYVDDYLPKSGARGGGRAVGRPPGGKGNGDGFEIDHDRLRAVVEKIGKEEVGAAAAVLVFLPGAPEISFAEGKLRDVRNVHVVPLHGQLAPEEQRRAFAPAPKGTLKVVLATNVAETSVTIPDVTHVVDSGRVKRMTFDARTQLAKLTEGWCSKASAAQRKGRAGRVRPGVCIRLYGKSVAETDMADHDLPEMHTAPLETLVMRALAIRPDTHPARTLGDALDPPPVDATRNAVARLRAIGAVHVDDSNADDETVALTPLGFHLSHLPVEPRLGKMLVLGCVMGCLSPVLTATAAMSCKPMFTARGGDKADATAAKRKVSRDSKSDHLACVYAFDEWSSSKQRGQTCRDLNLSHAAMQDVSQTRHQLRKQLEAAGFSPDSQAADRNKTNDDFVRCVLVAGLFPNVARVGVAENTRHPGSKTRVLNNRGVEVAVHPSGVNAAYAQGKDGSGRVTYQGGPEKGLLVYQEEVETSRVYLRDTTAVPDESVLLFGGALSVDHAASTVSVSTGAAASGTGKQSQASKFKFQCPPESGVLFKLLRKELDAVLATAAEDPSGDHGTLEGTARGRRVREVLERLLPGTGSTSRR